jgi:CBS domain-containing protein
MDTSAQSVAGFLEGIHPYDALPRDELARVAGSFSRRTAPAGETIYRQGDVLDGLYLIESGAVEITDLNGVQVSLLGQGNSFGERGLSRDGRAMTSARAIEDTTLLLLPAAEYRTLLRPHPPRRRPPQRSRHPSGDRPDDHRSRHLRARHPDRRGGAADA